MSRALRHRDTPPLEESALPLYMLWCKAQDAPVNRFDFINWLTQRMRRALAGGGDIEEMKAAVLAGIRAELEALAAQAAGPPLFGEYCLACANGIAGGITEAGGE